MGTDFQDSKTGNEAFDNIITSLQLLHEYVEKQDDDLTYALLIGGVAQGEGIHLVNSSVGNFKNPIVFKAAVKSLVHTMRESDFFTKLILSAYHEYKNNGNVKVVKLSVDSPLEALMLLKNLISSGNISELDDIPVELLEKLADIMPPEMLDSLKDRELCDDPECITCSMIRKFKNKKSYTDFTDLTSSPFFKKNDKNSYN